MINSCVAINCGNRRVNSNGVRFHKFPLENKELCLKWVAVLDVFEGIPHRSILNIDSRIHSFGREELNTVSDTK